MLIRYATGECPGRRGGGETVSAHWGSVFGGVFPEGGACPVDAAVAAGGLCGPGALDVDEAEDAAGDGAHAAQDAEDAHPEGALDHVLRRVPAPGPSAPPPPLSYGGGEWEHMAAGGLLLESHTARSD